MHIGCSSAAGHRIGLSIEEEACTLSLSVVFARFVVIVAARPRCFRYCDNVSNDTRRVVTVRTSNDAGKMWTQGWGCADAKQDGEHCQTFNTRNLVSACDCPEDPPDLEFHRCWAFTLGAA